MSHFLKLKFPQVIWFISLERVLGQNVFPENKTYTKIHVLCPNANGDGGWGGTMTTRVSLIDIQEPFVTHGNYCGYHVCPPRVALCNDSLLWHQDCFVMWYLMCTFTMFCDFGCTAWGSFMIRAALWHRGVVHDLLVSSWTHNTMISR